MTTTHTAADMDASRYSPRATCNGWHDWQDGRCARCGIASPASHDRPGEVGNSRQVGGGYTRHDVLGGVECPSWCSLPAGHPYGPEDGGVRRRTHSCERQVADGWAVEAWASEERSDQGITYSTPSVSVQVPEELTGAEAFALAAAIYRAAQALDAGATLERSLLAAVLATMGRQGLTVADVAARCGLSERQVGRRLSGAVELTVRDALGLADALGVPLSTLMQPEGDA